MPFYRLATEIVVKSISEVILVRRFTNDEEWATLQTFAWPIATHRISQSHQLQNYRTPRRSSHDCLPTKDYLLPRERGGCAKNSENSGPSRIVRRKSVKSRDRGSLDVYDASKTEVASSEVQINARKIHPAVKRGR